ncbi:MAG: hypothetical protein FJX77_05185 [Armatimonadetes bacterium]|nr:hypothetical protein [Armatimonadota bacterium]
MMTTRQRLAFLILQLNYGYTSWRGALQLARASARGDRSVECREAAEAVRASLEAADAALATVQTVRVRERELVPA